MATYISLIKLTQQGVTSIKDGPARLDAGKETLKSFGSELKAFYLTMGRYDIVVISEAPDDAAAAKVALAVGSAGNVTTETLPRLHRGRIPRDRGCPTLSDPRDCDRSSHTEPQHRTSPLCLSRDFSDTERRFLRLRGMSSVAGRS